MEIYVAEQIQKALNELSQKKGEDRVEAIGKYKAYKNIQELKEFVKKELKHAANEQR